MCKMGDKNGSLGGIEDAFPGIDELLHANKNRAGEWPWKDRIYIVLTGSEISEPLSQLATHRLIWVPSDDTDSCNLLLSPSAHLEVGPACR